MHFTRAIFRRILTEKTGERRNAMQHARNLTEGSIRLELVELMLPLMLAAP